MRALDRLIWEQASELEGFESADMLIVCNDPTGALVRAGVESGKRVVVADTDYSRCRQAAALGAEVVGDQRPRRVPGGVVRFVRCVGRDAEVARAP